MMFYVQGDTISLTRGDNATLQVELTDSGGQKYDLKPADKLVFSVKKSPLDLTVVFSIEADSDGTFQFLPVHTKALKFGKYKYDIQLTTENGSVYTVTPVSDFIVLEEITE